MLHAAIRSAFEGTVEELPAGARIDLLLDAVRAHADPALLAAYEALRRGPAGDGAANRAGAPGAGGRGAGVDLLDETFRLAAAAASAASLAGFLWISVLLARVGFSSPEAAIPVLDAIADGWLHAKAADPSATSSAVSSPPALSAAERAQTLALLAAPGRLPAGLAERFWEMVGGEVDPATITPRVAQFGETYDERLKDACARAVLRHPAQAELVREPWPPRVRIESLAGCAPRTLGHAYYHLIVDNGFDPEVLDPDGVVGFHPGLDGTNRRILQQHELWHLVAGYSTSPLHETAISAFQLAQFGHNYSAIFLATAVALLAFSAPVVLDPIVQVIAEAWRHGRTTPPMMAIDWPSHWDHTIEDIRARYSITPFASVVPDLLAPAA